MQIDDWFGSRSYRPFTVTIAVPGIFSSDSHGFSLNDKISLTTNGALPTGLAIDTYYFVIPNTYSNGSNDPDTFKLSGTQNGSAITTTGSQSGTHYYATALRQRIKPSPDSNR